MSAVRRASAALFDTVDALNETTMHGPSRLPDWTRGHVVSHLARNADGLVNLLSWARTGIESPMYASQADREADIQEGAHRLAQVQQEDLRAAAERFAMATEVMSESDWEATVTNWQGRSLPVSMVPWMRLTEVLVHHVDLNSGCDFDRIVELTGEQIEPFIDYVVTRYAGRADVPPLRLTIELPTGDDRTWLLGECGDPADVRTAAATALAWLTGRDRMSGLPRLPAWL
jgi:maleylpyruvate isomerase